MLELVATGDGTDPFHHFALLVPGDRFDAARAWLGERVEPLARDDGETVFPFDFWDARAAYFHDPAGNIVELIAHAGVAEQAPRATSPRPSSRASRRSGSSSTARRTPSPRSSAS